LLRSDAAYTVLANSVGNLEIKMVATCNTKNVRNIRGEIKCLRKTKETAI
jgi:hypothetical protein